MVTTVLFTQEKSIYLQLGCDCWDIHRDARNYAGSDPVIAHPPCRTWSKMKSLAKPNPAETELALMAIDIVRKNGGVLEHPKGSGLFTQGYLPLPGKPDPHGGFSICVDQFWWGHLCKKPTLLYIVGVKQSELPAIPYSLDCVTRFIASSKATRHTKMKHISKAGRSATPIEFAKWLIQVAALCKKSGAQSMDNEGNCCEFQDSDCGESEFDPCDKCDGHPACEDFGCAFDHGLGNLVKRDLTSDDL